MAGEIKRMIDRIIEERSRGNPALVSSTRIKLVMKGIHSDKFDHNSANGPIILDKLQTWSENWGSLSYKDREVLEEEYIGHINQTATMLVLK